MNAYSYKGLVSNELRGGRTWGCPQENYLPSVYTQVQHTSPQHRYMLLGMHAYLSTLNALVDHDALRGRCA